MLLTVGHDDGEYKEVASRENLLHGLQSMHDDTAGFVILDDSDANSFMQAYTHDDKSYRVEYQSDSTHFFADRVSSETVTELFLFFAERDHSWKSAVEWAVDAEVTAGIGAAKAGEIDKPRDVDLDTDFELDADGVLRWTIPVDKWAPDT